MRMLFLLAVVCFSITQLSAQTNTGFYGRKVFFEVNSANQFALLNAAFNENGDSYKRDGKKLDQGKDLFNTSLNVVFGGAVSSKVALSVEAGLFFGSFASPAYLSSNDDFYTTIYMRHEMLDFRTITIMPKIEVSARGSNSPSGLTHQIGIGFAQSKVVEKDYLYDITTSDADSASQDLSKTLLDYEDTYKGLTLMYALNMRTPINKRMFFNYGIRYTANFSERNLSTVSGSYWMSESEVGRSIGRTRLWSVISFQLGFSFML